MATTINMLGQKFTRLSVVQCEGPAPDRQITWKCICDCGNKVVVLGGSLRSGHTKSCGCLNLEQSIKRFTTHGMTETSTYAVWKNMLNRCNNPNVPAYKDYGGRGIKVCQQWLSFDSFLKDMGERPPSLFLDRIDNNKGYQKTNCRWATRTEQARNRRSNRFFTVSGKTMILADWAKSINTSPSTILDRLARGWSIEDACTQQPRMAAQQARRFLEGRK